MDKPLLRWGILGTAQIARKNWKAIRNSGNGVVTAVASRDISRCGRFIADCQAQAPFQKEPRAIASYEALLAANDVDAVYIPLPTGIRKDWVIRAAQAGKHVVCEKPCAVNQTDLAEMLEACRRNRVQFMDGVMFMHSARLDRMREVLDDGKTVGRIRRISSAFSFNAPPEFFASNIRVQSGLEPLGCLGDLGWYCIRFAMWAMDWKLPSRVTGRVLSEAESKTGQVAVPTEFSGELIFPGGASSGFYCSFITEFQQWANISGTLGSLALSDFVLAEAGAEVAFMTQNPVVKENGCDVIVEPNSRRLAVGEYSHGHPTAQESSLFRHFADQIRSGVLNQSWPEMALKTQRVLQGCLESARADGRITALLK